MAIVAVLAGIISVSVAGSGQTSRDTQTQQDATTVETAVANYFGNQEGTETRNPLVVEVLGQRNIEQVTSNKWPEKFITVAYPEVFPEGTSSEIGSIFFEDRDGEVSDLRVRGLLQRFNAVDFDILSDGGFLTAVPKNSSETSRGFASYLWLLEKSVTSSSNRDVSSREVAVFKLQTVNSLVGSEIVDLTYRRLFGGLFADAIPEASSFTVVTDEDTPTTVTLLGTDLDTCELTFTIEEGTTHGLLTPITDHECVTSELEEEPNTDSASVTYLPDLNFNGEDSFTYSVIDGNGDSLGTVTVTINVVNDTPTVTVSTLNDIEVNEDAPASFIDVSGAFDDVDIATNADSLTYSVSSNTNSSMLSASVGPSLLDSELNLQFLPDQNGTAVVTVRATDISLDFAEDTFNVKVNPVNDPPTFIVGAHVTSLEDDAPYSQSGWASGISPGPADESAQGLSFFVTNNTNPGLFSSAPAVLPDGTLSYTSVANASGVATITLELRDTGGTALGGIDTSESQTFVITVEPVNDAPDFVRGVDQSGPEDGGTKLVPGWATGIIVGPADESAQLSTLAFNVTGNTNPTLFSTLPAVDSSGTLTYTPAADANGSATITLVLNDGGGTSFGGGDTSVAKSFLITVNVVNDPPTFTAGADEDVLEDAGPQIVPWASSISAGPPDEFGQTLTFIVGNNNNALFSVQPAVSSIGTLTYTPAIDANGSATVTVALKDNGGRLDTTSPQSFTITVDAVNDAPNFTAGADQFFSADSGPHSVSGWTSPITSGPPNESGQTLNIMVSNDNNSLFSVQPAILANGTLNLTPATSAFGSALVTVLVQDNGGTANGGINTSLSQDFLIEVVDGLVLASCTDLDSAGVTYVLVTDLYASGGCLSVSAHDVTLDGNFHALLGDGVIAGVNSTANKGIQASSVTRLTVKNLEISYFNVGVNLGRNNNGVTGNLLHNNTHSGIFLANNTTTGNFITENDFGGPAAASLPESCQDIRDANPGATDGDYTISPSGQTFTVYCLDMGGTPSEYLTLDNTGGNFNFGQYTIGGATNRGTTVRTRYTKVRIDPVTLLVHTGDQTFSTSTGELIHSSGSSVVSSMPYGTAAGCNSTANGLANIDLRGTPFAVNDTFAVKGFPTGLGGATFSASDQIMNITGGGFCGDTGPAPTLFFPVNTRGTFSLNLAYVGPLNTGTGFGVYAANSDDNNETYNNNFLTTNAVFNGTGEIFFKPLPIGGNFWAGNTSCTDTDLNAVCDTPFNGDQLPWATQSGWLMPSAPAPFRNGSFEQDPINLNYWTVESGSIDWISSFDLWDASDGVRSLDMNGSEPGKISQSFDTVPGIQYEVLFDMAGNFGTPQDNPLVPGAPDTIATMDVSAAGSSQSYSFNFAGRSARDMGYEEKTFLFTATSSTTKLIFESTNEDDLFNGPVLDNVRVNFAPALPVVFFQDNYDTASTSLTADLGARQTGSVITPVSYTTDSSNGGGTAQILSNRLDLVGSGGARSAILGHDFRDSQLTQNGGYSVCMVVSPTAFTSSTRFALAMGQTDPLLPGGAGTGFPASNTGTDIGLRMIAFFGTLSIDFSGAYDLNPALNKNYQLLMTVATTSFTSGAAFSADVSIDGLQVGPTFNGTWDGSENYISFSALDGGFAVDNLKIFDGITTTCSS